MKTIFLFWLMGGIGMAWVHFDLMGKSPIWYGWLSMAITVGFMCVGGLIVTIVRWAFQ